jgi:hypothetical protein
MMSMTSALHWWSMCNRIERDLLATARRARHVARRRINTIVNHAVAVVGCGAIVSACSGMPSINLSAFKSSPPTEQVSIESDPPGADARTATGVSCRTPCTLGLPMSDGSITVALDGYTAQTVPVQLEKPADTRPDTFTPQPHLTPNPVVVELQPAPPPPVKKPVAKKPKVVARAKPAAEQAPTTTSTLSPAPAGAAMAPPPWPTPR